MTENNRELADLRNSGFDLSLTGFEVPEIDALLATEEDRDADTVPPLPNTPVSRVAGLWLCGKHRVLCGDCTDAQAVSRLLADRNPRLMVTDPPYGIELDSEWRDRAGLNGCGAAEPSWNTLRIAVTGDHHQAWLNDTKIVDVTDKSTIESEAAWRQPQPISIQAPYRTGVTIKCRNIRVRTP